VCFVLATLLFPSRDAWAFEGFMRWLERLSGPGPFSGPVFGVPIPCDYLRPDGFIFKDCPWSLPQLDTKLTVEIGRLRGTSDLDYGGAQLTDDERRVIMWTFHALYEIRLHPSFDVGVGAGLLRFKGDPSLFDGFWRVAFEPVRATARPLLWFGDGTGSPWKRVLKVRLGTLWIPEGFTERDFGAVGPWRSEDLEIPVSLSIGLDFGELLWGTR
jgi:hypothetical protein